MNDTPPPRGTRPPIPPGLATPTEDELLFQRNGRLTRRSFLVGGTAALLGLGAWQWLRTSALLDNVAWPLRRVLEFNEAVVHRVFGEGGLAPLFPATAAATGDAMRINGRIGLDAGAGPAGWTLAVEHADGRRQRFGVGAIQSLPKASTVTELKCIEGWSQVLAWTGTAFGTFMTAHLLGTRSGAAPDPLERPDDLYRYVYLETPGGGYYVGLDRASAWHPQTLLCYEMGGQPLTAAHGAPLRLAIPVKYGIKNIKRIGLIRFTDERPADYWAERGYDWYAGL